MPPTKRHERCRPTCSRCDSAAGARSRDCTSPGRPRRCRSWRSAHRPVRSRTVRPPEGTPREIRARSRKEGRKRKPRVPRNPIDNSGQESQPERDDKAAAINSERFLPNPNRRALQIRPAEKSQPDPAPVISDKLPDPTDHLFTFFVRADAHLGAHLRFEDFCVHLICVYDGRPGPWGAELDRLRREALPTGLSLLGFATLEGVTKTEFRRRVRMAE
jgi:hypothetical protein